MNPTHPTQPANPHRIGRPFWRPPAVAAILGIFVPFFAATCGVNAGADCITTKQLAAGPPYAEFELMNRCRGDAIVHWTRKTDTGHSEPGKWYVLACKTQQHQYSPGNYEFGDVEFPNGGGNERCLPAHPR
jgi:hypothetical protein